RPEPHQEIVRMLIVDQRNLIEAFAGLIELRCAANRRQSIVSGVNQPSDRPGLERDHRVDEQASPTDTARAVEHRPILRVPRGEVGKASLLVVVAEKSVCVGHPAPALLRLRRVRVWRRVLVLLPGRGDRRHTETNDDAYEKLDYKIPHGDGSIIPANRRGKL